MGAVKNHKQILQLIDAKGLTCPKPLILTKNALEDLQAKGAEGILQVFVDNEASKINVGKFVKTQGLSFDIEEIREDNNEKVSFMLNIYLLKNKMADIKFQAEPALRKEKKADFAVNYLLGKDTMGSGSEELGKILMRSFFYTLLETKPLPKKILFINSAIMLTLKDSFVLEHLKELERLGVEILVCGTCLDFFQKKEELAVGEVTNMYTVVEALTEEKVKTVTVC